jgi:hypothetical protein
MDLYYYLLNEVSVFECNAENLDISSNGSNKSFNLRIENILSTLTGSKTKIRLMDKVNDTSLKASLIDNFKNSEQWKTLEENFPGAKILDMIHKDGV